MEEIVTDAVVLQNRSFAYYGNNRNISLFTEKLGRVEATAISGFKITSKLSPHLNPLNLVRVRLINKNKFIIADALTIDTFKNIRKDEYKLKGFFDLFFLVQSLTPQILPDHNLWQEIIERMKKSEIKNKNILNILGYEPSFSDCFKCGKKNIDYFLIEDQLFLCSKCKTKINDDKLIKIID
ncbi:MAG: DNA repair protein RecO [Candidatus Paceibacterota bacterium]